jgi:hypothetical protein
MSLGTRVRLIASTAHRLVVERSYIYKVLIYASLQIVQYYLYWISLQFTQFAIKLLSLMELILSLAPRARSARAGQVGGALRAPQTR